MYPQANGGQTYATVGNTPMTHWTEGAKSATERVTVHSALDAQQQQIAELYNVIGELTVRLDPVLDPLPPAAGAGSAPTPTPIQVLQRIGAASTAINNAVGDLRHLLARLHL
jgi:hypothetical protein